MATWLEVQQRVRKDFSLDRDSEGEFALTVQRPDGQRAQRVMVRRYFAFNEEMIEIRSAFGEADKHDPTALLVENLQLPIGCIAQHGRFLVVIHKAALKHSTVEGVLFMLTRIGLLADILEERTGTDRF